MSHYLPRRVVGPQPTAVRPVEVLRMLPHHILDRGHEGLRHSQDVSFLVVGPSQLQGQPNLDCPVVAANRHQEDREDRTVQQTRQHRRPCEDRHRLVEELHHSTAHGRVLVHQKVYDFAPPEGIEQLPPVTTSIEYVHAGSFAQTRELAVQAIIRQASHHDRLADILGAELSAKHREGTKMAAQSDHTPAPGQSRLQVLQTPNLGHVEYGLAHPPVGRSHRQENAPQRLGQNSTRDRMLLSFGKHVAETPTQVLAYFSVLTSC